MDPDLPVVPAEIQAQIASYLGDGREVATYREVNTYWYHILSPLCWHTSRFQNLNFYRGVQFKYLRRMLEHVDGT